MVYSVMTILQDKSFGKKKQLSAVLLVRSEVNQMYVFPFLAMPEARRKKLFVDTTAWRILDLPEREEEEAAKYYLQCWLGVAREKSTPAIIASSCALEMKGVKIEPFGKGWPGDWEQIGKQKYAERGCVIEGPALPWLLQYDPDNDLAKAFHAAWYLAARFNFFGTTPDEATQAILDNAGAREVGGAGDLRNIGLKRWTQKYIPAK